MRNETTELEKVKKGAKFTWGKIVKIHTVGRYDVVEYLDGLKGETETRFHPYVDGKDFSTSCKTLEEALIAAIATERLKEPNDSRWTTMMIMRLLKSNEM